MVRGPSQAETVIKTIIRKIIQRCQEKGSSLSETLVGFMVKSVVLDPNANFSVDRSLTQADVDRLIDMCTARLTDHTSPCLDTIKMQVYFDMNYTSRGEFLSEHRRVIKSRLASSVNEICESRARSREELQNLYRRIVSYILLESGLGSPTDISIVKETTTALQSVFPPAELGSFLEFTRKDKEKHLHELTRIVSGIRLFNKSNGTGSSRGIEDLPTILNEAIQPAIDEITKEREAAQHVANLYTAIVKAKENHENHDEKEIDHFDKMKGALYNIIQWEVFLRILFNELIKSSKQIETLNNKLDENYKQIQLAVQMRTAVPTRQVYPLFIKLSELWTFFQEEIVLLSVFQNIRVNAKEFIRIQATLFPSILLEKCSAGLEIMKGDDYVKAAEAGEKINDETGKKDKNSKDVTWLYPDNLSKNLNIEQLTFQFRSFCPFMLAEHGLLIPGTSSIGILCYDEDFFVFSSSKAAELFCENIPKMISKISDLARVSTELINLVQLQRQFQTLANQNNNLKRQPRLQADAGTQTDTHIKDSYIDKEYEWNEWEMRRKAIKLANLRKCVTDSSQTILSNFLRENETQVYLPKDSWTVTKRDGQTEVPNQKMFYHGLRGKTEAGSFKQVDITDYREVNPNRK
jgi:hypothetical protein